MLMHTISSEIVDLKGLTPAQIDAFCTAELGQKTGQGIRVAIRLFRNKTEAFDAMTDLNRAFREQLKHRCVISSLSIEMRTAADDGTEKLLYRLSDGNAVEGVLIPGPERLTLCVSTQIGCASGCGFCLTGADGLVRNLTVAEIVNQYFAALRIAGERRISNIVLMGTGEPLHNYDAVKAFVEIVTDRNGMGYSPKKVTLSTCGIAPMIEKMADDMDASLAVSLHAATDALRDRIMPVNKTYPIARLMDALRYYCDKTGRTVTIEYSLFRGVNDAAEDARMLAALLGDLPCMINLLLFNPYPGCAFERPDEERAFMFRDLLLQAGYVSVVRNSRGSDVGAACGQLRARAAEKKRAE